MLNPASESGITASRAVRRTLADYEELKDSIAMPGLEKLSDADRRAVNRCSG